MLVGGCGDFQSKDDVLTTKVGQLNVGHVFENEVDCGRFLRIVRINAEDRLACAREKNADDLGVMKTGPGSEPLRYGIRPDQFRKHTISMRHYFLPALF